MSPSGDLQRDHPSHRIRSPKRSVGDPQSQSQPAPHVLSRTVLARETRTITIIDFGMHPRQSRRSRSTTASEISRVADDDASPHPATPSDVNAEQFAVRSAVGQGSGPSTLSRSGRRRDIGVS